MHWNKNRVSTSTAANILLCVPSKHTKLFMPFPLSLSLVIWENGNLDEKSHTKMYSIKLKMASSLVHTATISLWNYQSDRERLCCSKKRHFLHSVQHTHSKYKSTQNISSTPEHKAREGNNMSRSYNLNDLYPTMRNTKCLYIYICLCLLCKYHAERENVSTLLSLKKWFFDILLEDHAIYFNSAREQH